MEILAVLFFLVVVGGAFFTLIFLACFLPYWVTMQLIETFTYNPKTDTGDTE
tara:strand:- start:3608 stop:3763 length:156 start_codon:yes stop_codon:yes gene_type:complete